MKKWQQGFFAALLLCLCMTGVAGCAKKEETTQTKQITCVDDLEGARIGVQLGTTGDIYVSDYEGDEAGTTIERYNKGADAVQALKLGKIDCVVIDEQPALQFVKQNSDISILEEEFTLEDYALLTAKDNTALLDQINGALMKLQNDGTVDEIIKNYIGTEEEVGHHPYVEKDVERTNGKLIMGTNAEFPPYEYYENNQITGIDVDIMRAIADELGMELQIEDMAFDSIIAAVTAGKVNVGASGFTVTEERKKSVNFSNSYITSKQVIIVRGGDGTASGSLQEKLYNNFIKDNRYQYIVKGLGNTLLITVFAVILGIVLGFLIAIIRTGHDRNGGFTILNAICKVYLTVMRGTPVMIQLLIIYYVILASATNKIMVAAIAFGLNSAAYVAEIVRSGIMSVDIGQMEAGRAVGLSFGTTMLKIVIPQAVKNILPTLGNEFITLIKETSVVSFVGAADLYVAFNYIGSNSYEFMVPYLVMAIIYIVLVLIISLGIKIMERSLRKSDRRH